MQGMTSPKRSVKGPIELGIELTLLKDQRRRTTHGCNKCGPGDYTEFKYLTPKKRLEVNDLVEEGLFTAQAFHLICTPARVGHVCSGLYKTLEGRLLHPMPLVIWEPVPGSCDPALMMEMYITPAFSQ